MEPSKQRDTWDWDESADVSDRERIETLASRSRGLAHLPEGERQHALKSMVVGMPDSPTEKSVLFNRWRLRAWLSLDPVVAMRLAESYAAVMVTVPGAVAWRQLVTIQHAAKDLSADEQRRLHLLFPKEIPEPTGGSSEVVRHGTLEPTPRRIHTGRWHLFARRNGAKEVH